MLVQAAVILVVTLECWSVRRQFNHYQEYLQSQALRNRNQFAELKKPKKDRYYEPERTLYYNPTYGYEGYWKGGDWIFQRKTKEQRAKKNDDCGSDCFQLYVRYGPVCARSRNGTYGNFSSICAMKSDDCPKLKGWLVMHRGACNVKYPILHPYIPMTYLQSSMSPTANAARIISAFSSKFPGVGEDLDWV